MNFLKTPSAEVTDNSEMDDEQICIAEEFINGLVKLGVLMAIPPEEMLANGPLFCVPKPGQPGQWRIIADMKRGGQNSTIGADPMVFPKTGTILDQMYTGGWSAVVDVSKYFYHFNTRPEDQPYLGCLHPRNPDELRYVYGGLPMGSGASPAIAGKFGAAFVRLLKERCPVFQGKPTNNTWWNQFLTGQACHPLWGLGMVLCGADGQPAALCWGHCDDFIIHAPTQTKCMQALHEFLDWTVRVGLLAHPKKLTPPAQQVKYTGLIFDTRAEPCLRIPEGKREKALAMLDFVEHHRTRISRLCLAVLIGVLESLVDATPPRLGHTYLRSLQDTIHPEGWDEADLPYFSFASLMSGNLRELNLWRQML
jgi:hypothetical protein